MICPRTRYALALLAAPFVLAGCQDAETEAGVLPEAASSLVADESASPANVVEVTGMDYAFQAPLEIPAGWTTFRFANEGPETHHMVLMRLEGGHSVGDLVEALQNRQPLQGIATALGGPNAPMPGAFSNATMELSPGEYALACLIPSPDGVPHIFKGMVKPITVTDAASAADVPAPDLEITFTDYAFGLSGEITAGERTIRVTTAPSATEPHELVLARLAPGTTAEDLNRWMHEMQGPPPAEFLGGVTALDPGQSNTFTAEFTPGEYALICPLPSVHDGEPHSMKGMMHQFTVS